MPRLPSTGPVEQALCRIREPGRAVSRVAIGQDLSKQQHHRDRIVVRHRVRQTDSEDFRATLLEISEDRAALLT